MSRSRVLGYLAAGLAFVVIFWVASSPRENPAAGFEELLRSTRRRAVEMNRTHRLVFGDLVERLARTDVVLSRRPDWIDFLPTGEARLPGTYRVNADGWRRRGDDFDPPPDLVFTGEEMTALVYLDLPRGGISRTWLLRNR